MDRFKMPIALGLVGLVLIIGGVFASSLQKPNSREFPKESMLEGQKFILVDVSGAVLKPGVYQLNQSARVEDAINAAGGFSDAANDEYISKYLNLAQKLVDGNKIYIPVAGEQFSGSQTGAVVTSTQVKVNINLSAQSELEALPGIGPVTASKIISDRPYQKIEELLDKKIVNKTTFEKIKGQIVVY